MGANSSMVTFALRMDVLLYHDVHCLLRFLSGGESPGFLDRPYVQSLSEHSVRTSTAAAGGLWTVEPADFRRSRLFHLLPPPHAASAGLAFTAVARTLCTARYH